MKNLTKILLSLSILASPVNSYAQKFKNQVNFGGVQAAEHRLVTNTELVIDEYLRILDFIIKEYNSGLINSFNEHFLKSDFRNVYEKKILIRNYEKNLRFLKKQNVSPQDLDLFTFFFYFNHYFFKSVNSSKKLSKKISREDKERINLKVFNKLTELYKNNSELLNKKYSTDIISNDYSVFFDKLTDLLNELEKSEKSNASISAFEILKQHFLTIQNPERNNFVNYINSFNKILNNVADKKDLDKNDEFYEKLINDTLDFFESNQTIIPFDNEYIDVIITSLEFLEFPEEQVIKMYNLIKTKILTETYRGVPIIHYTKNLSSDSFIEFNTIFSKIFDAFYFLLNKTLLDKEKELSSLENTIIKHLKINMKYLTKFAGSNKRIPYLLTLQDQIKIFNTSMNWLGLLNNSQRKQNVNDELMNLLHDFIIFKLAGTSEFLYKKDVINLFNNISVSGNKKTLNSLIKPLNDKLVSNERTRSFNEYLFYLSLINTEKSLDEFCEALKNSYKIYDKKFSNLELISREELIDNLNYFSFELLASKAVDLAISQKKLEKLLAVETSIKTIVLKDLIIDVVISRAKTKEQLEQTTNMLKQVYIPENYSIYLEKLKLLPPTIAGDKIMELYGAWGDKKIAEQVYYKVMKQKGGYELFVKEIIDSLKELNDDFSKTYILKIILDHYYDEDSKEIVEYAKESLSN